MSSANLTNSGPVSSLTPQRIGKLLAEAEVYPIQLVIAARLHLDGISADTAFLGWEVKAKETYHKTFCREEHKRKMLQNMSGTQYHFLLVINYLRDLERGLPVTPRLKTLAMELTTGVPHE